MKAMATFTFVAVFGTAHAACLDDAEVRRMAAHYEARTAAPDFASPLSDADARCTRTKYQQALAERAGPPIGYKVGLTNEAIRRMVKGDAPVWGAMYGALLPSGSTVAANFGARPTVEADLLVRVRSAAIHEAKTREELLATLDQVIPFIELPDMLLANPLKMDARAMMVINMAARAGVAGPPLGVPESEEARAALVQALGAMKLTMTDGERVVGQSVGSELMGHPLDAALWLVRELTRDGVRLQPGQVLSLGSFPPVLPVRAGMRFQVRYDGLPGAEPVAVQFR